MINEDPNYFIRSKRMRSVIKLFESEADEFTEDVNAKIRGKIIKEQFFKKSKEERVMGEIREFESKFGVEKMPKWLVQIKEKIIEAQKEDSSEAATMGIGGPDIPRSQGGKRP